MGDGSSAVYPVLQGINKQANKQTKHLQDLVCDVSQSGYAR